MQSSRSVRGSESASRRCPCCRHRATSGTAPHLLGQRCRDRGFTIGPFDLLIASVALHHDAEIIAFDGDYSLIAEAEPELRVQVLIRVV
jgi:hypothetical protein